MEYKFAIGLDLGGEDSTVVGVTCFPENRHPIFIGILPDGYEYRFVKVDGMTKVVGIQQNKEPICFRIEDNKLIEEKL